MIRNLLPLGVGAFSVAWTAVAAAQEAQPVTIRATIEAVADDGAALNVRTRSGGTAIVRLKSGAIITLVVPATLADVKPGLFVGVAALPGANGEQNALEVHIFPEAMRGVGEGFRAFDLAPGSTMTNGSVEARVDSVDGPRLTVTYKGGAQTIVLDKATPIVAFAPGVRADLKPGAAIVARAAKTADGAFGATRVLVGKDGLKPPM